MIFITSTGCLFTNSHTPQDETLIYGVSISISISTIVSSVLPSKHLFLDWEGVAASEVLLNDVVSSILSTDLHQLGLVFNNKIIFSFLFFIQLVLYFVYFKSFCDSVCVDVYVYVCACMHTCGYGYTRGTY